jgi:hypothetical protein
LNEHLGSLFPLSNWWNRDIRDAPVDPDSDRFIDFVGRSRRLHPDFGPPPYGMPYVTVGSSQPRVPVTFISYGSESDTEFQGVPGYPIPEEAKTRPNFIEGGAPGGGSSGDHHLLMVDRDRWVLYELYATRVGGKPAQAPSSISTAMTGARKAGHPRTRPGWRFSQV